mmetsp:Transcript_31866/g.69733  ORF Transcript_31866/g.69733 Transcript_31866/m.69733 type:complete len:333 (-) Transcript_31866:807-1805(-)
MRGATLKRPRQSRDFNRAAVVRVHLAVLSLLLLQVTPEHGDGDAKKRDCTDGADGDTKDDAAQQPHLLFLLLLLQAHRGRVPCRRRRRRRRCQGPFGTQPTWHLSQAAASRQARRLVLRFLVARKVGVHTAARGEAVLHRLRAPLPSGAEPMGDRAIAIAVARGCWPARGQRLVAVQVAPALAREVLALTAQRVSAVAVVGRAHLPRAGALPAVDLHAVVLLVLATLGLARQGIAEAAKVRILAALGISARLEFVRAIRPGRRAEPLLVAVAADDAVAGVACFSVEGPALALLRLQRLEAAEAGVGAALGVGARGVLVGAVLPIARADPRPV